MKRESGSVTIFFGMTVMILLSLFFTLTETLRFLALNACAENVSVRTAEGMTALYNRVLFDEYGIMGMDLSMGSGSDSDTYISQKLMSYLETAGNPDTKKADFLRLSAETTELSSYVVYTDVDGAPFIHAGALRAKWGVPSELLGAWQDDCDTLSGANDNSAAVSDLLISGEDAVRASKEAGENADAGNAGGLDDAGGGEVGDGGNGSQTEYDPAEVAKYEGVENPIEVWKTLREKGMLSLVLPDGKSASERTMPLSSVVSHRALSGGKAGSAGNAAKKGMAVSAVDKLLFEQYLLGHFSNFTRDANATNAASSTDENAGGIGGLSYETEYVIEGKECDRDNLEAVLLKILGLREAENFAAIYTDPVKRNEARSCAAAIAGISANPAIIEAVQWGIIAAWALIESVLDIRTLLSGGKVSILKTPEEWTSSLRTLASCVSPAVKAKESKQGISYEGYLRAMLFLLSDKNLSYRAMDVIEYTIRQHEGYGNIRMDRMLYTAELTLTLSAKPIFFTFVPQVAKKIYRYRFQNTEQISYE